MLREYESWLADAEEMAAGDAKALFYTQLTLGSGVLFLTLGILLSAAGAVDPIDTFAEASNRSVTAAGIVF